MEIEYYGGNCLRISAKKASLVIDDNLETLGLKSITKKDDIVMLTGAYVAPTTEVKLAIDQPGEYEVSGVSIQGVAARSHTDEPTKLSATVYKLIVDDVRIVVAGHIYPELDDSQLEALGTVDVLIIPVGGNGYTLDPVGALEIIKKIEPKLVIPTHYDDKKVKYPVPQQELTTVLKELSIEVKETTTKLKLKLADLTDTTQLVVLERQ